MPQEVRLQITDPAALVLLATLMKEPRAAEWDTRSGTWSYGCHNTWSLFVLPNLELAVYTRKVDGTAAQGAYLGRIYLWEKIVRRDGPLLTQFHASIHSRLLEDSEDEVVEAFAQVGIKAVFKKEKKGKP